jgi:hypothetical protein
VVRHEFDAIIGNLGAFYERKVRPIPMTLDMWFEKVKKIPSEAVTPIQQRIMDECEGWPKNITAMMWALYHQWLSAHPEKRAHREAVDCPDCEGGWLALQKNVDGYRQKISHSAACGRCKQIPSAQYMTLFQAKEHGYERVDLLTYPVHANRNLKAMIESVAKRMPEKPRITWD